MLDKADLTLLSIVGLVLVGSYLHSRFLLKIDAAKVQKYRLYKVRDELIFLVASGLLNEDDFVFTYFYRTVHLLIKSSDLLNLRSLLAVLRKAKQEGIDPAATEIQAKIARELASKDPRVSDVVRAFYQAIVEIILENSLIIRTLANQPSLTWLLGRVGDLASRLRNRVWRNQREAYDVYIAYNRAAQNPLFHSYSAAA